MKSTYVSVILLAAINQSTTHLPMDLLESEALVPLLMDVLPAECEPSGCLTPAIDFYDSADDVTPEARAARLPEQA